MEHESLEYKIVMDGSEVLARLSHLDIAGPAYRAAVLKYPQRNVQLRHGARIIERHDGAPPPPPLVERDHQSKELVRPPDRRQEMHFLGYLEAVDEAVALVVAAATFNLNDEQRKRLAVNPRR
jgi:hypothetical protein